MCSFLNRTVPPPAVESKAGGDGGGPICSFKLLLRGSMIELYININDVLSKSSLHCEYSGQCAPLQLATAVIGPILSN